MLRIYFFWYELNILGRTCMVTCLSKEVADQGSQCSSKNTLLGVNVGELEIFPDNISRGIHKPQATETLSPTRSDCLWSWDVVSQILAPCPLCYTKTPVTSLVLLSL